MKSKPFHRLMRLNFLLVTLATIHFIDGVNGQSNYAVHGNNIGYQGEGLPEEATLDGKVKDCKNKLFQRVWSSSMGLNA